MVGIAVNQNEAKIIDEVAALLKKAGYIPYDQIYGYAHSGCDFYITRNGGARDIIKLVSPEALKEYLQKEEMQNNR